MEYVQNYDPLGVGWLSVLAAAAPVVTLLYLLALHPTVKPVSLVSDAILDCTARGDIVLDGFLGSGTTVIAAERTGRRCFGTELDPGYVDTIIRRWQKLTGNAARHAATGRSFDDLACRVEVADAA